MHTFAFYAKCVLENVKRCGITMFFSFKYLIYFAYATLLHSFTFMVDECKSYIVYKIPQSCPNINDHLKKVPLNKEEENALNFCDKRKYSHVCMYAQRHCWSLMHDTRAWRVFRFYRTCNLKKSVKSSRTRAHRI